MTVQEIFDMYVSGSSYKQIADKLNSEGKQTIRNFSFKAASILEIVYNPNYGEKVFMKPEDCEKLKESNGAKKPMSILSDPSRVFYPIVEKEVWEQAKKEFVKRRKLHEKPHLFTKMITCGICGKKYNVRHETNNK